jgi:hypothetical protein
VLCSGPASALLRHSSRPLFNALFSLVKGYVAAPVTRLATENVPDCPLWRSLALLRCAAASMSTSAERATARGGEGARQAASDTHGFKRNNQVGPRRGSA